MTGEATIDDGGIAKSFWDAVWNNEEEGSNFGSKDSREVDGKRHPATLPGSKQYLATVVFDPQLLQHQESRGQRP